MSVAEFVSHLKDLDIRLSAEGERLRINAPRGVLAESLRVQIAERKKELLDFLRENSAPAALNPHRIVRRMDAGPTPLSFAQERIWFVEQLESAGAVYNVCRASRLLGKLNISAIESSLNEILRRHEVLRSSIRVVDGRSVQVFEPPYRVNLPIIDLHAMPEVEREQKMRDRIQQAAEAPFDFTAGKFLRAELLSVADNEHVLILTTHHIVSDAWSMGILTRELWSLYETCALGKSFPLEELQIQYADFAAWQRECLQGEVLEKQVSYWKEQLKDLTHLNLPTDRPRPMRQSFEAARISIGLPETLTTAIHELSTQAGVTPFMILLVAFQVLLYRYCGQEDVVVGSSIVNRGRPEFEPLIGCFVNTLVLRADLSGNPTFNTLLAQVRDVCLCAFSYQDMPFEKLVYELQPQRDLSRNPLFQVMFVLQNATRPFTGIPGVQIEPLEIESLRSPFDLSLFVRERDGKYIGYIEYSTDLFNRNRIERMTKHFQKLLEGIIADPDQPISRLSMLTESERHQLLVEWNDTAADYPADKCIHELVEVQAEGTPDAVAVSFKSQKLTYRELNERANQLGHYLKKLGVESEKLVGICVERSLEMVVGLLGILKAGGAYVPLDPTYPRERLTFMLEDAHVSILLTQAKLVEDRRWKMDDSSPRSTGLGPQMKIVCLDRDWEKIAKQSGENFDCGATAQNLAYVIYTSGSTGKPKGVQVSHRSVVNCLRSIAEQVGLAERDIFLAITTISFDIAALELYLPLITGAKIVLACGEEVLDGRRLIDRLKKCGATAMQATPSGWRLLLESGWRSNRKFKILSGGEILSRQLADQLLEGGGSLWNLYGPTETTIWSTMARVEPSARPVVIGRPVANTQLYILDSLMQLAPIGVRGELHIGGDGLARGYSDRPELNAEKFVANPFSRESGAVLYRTGDLARYLPDGNIEFLGRVDNQVKIRGHRIELGEIEAALNQHPAVRRNLVIAYDDLREESGAAETRESKTHPEHSSTVEKNLVAYLVLSGPKPSIADLRNFLRGKLPEVMLPSAFVILDALPVTPNGKVDRNALLPARGRRSRPQLSQGFIGPRTEIEELMVQVWRAVLKLDKIGIHDNFFELGGHSLSAMQVVSRIHQTFRLKITLREFFEAPSVAAISQTIQEKIVGNRRKTLPPIVPVSRKNAFPLLASQRQLWEMDRLFPGTLFLNMPYVYQFKGDLNVEVLRLSLQEMVRRHEAFQLVFHEENGQLVQRLGPIPAVELPIFHLKHLGQVEAGEKLESLAAEDASLPFNLETGPAFRFKLVQLTAVDYRLLMTIHHIICDHWSMQIFRRELAVFYEAFIRGESPNLTEVSVQFLDFVSWQRLVLKAGLLKSQMSYWKRRLVTPSPRLKFYNNPMRKADTSFRMSMQSIEVGEQALARIRAIATTEHCTLFIVLLAVLNIVIWCHTGQSDIRVGTTVSNRDRGELQSMMGYLINNVILRTLLTPGVTFRQLLKRVKRVALSAFANHELPFGSMVRTLRKENPRIQKRPLFEVMFIYHNLVSYPLETPGLEFALPDGKYRRVAVEVVLTTLKLIFDIREASTKLTGTVIYKTDFVNDGVVSEMLETFYDTLDRVVLEPNRRLNTLVGGG